MKSYPRHGHCTVCGGRGVSLHPTKPICLRRRDCYARWTKAIATSREKD